MREGVSVWGRTKAVQDCPEEKWRVKCEHEHHRAVAWHAPTKGQGLWADCSACTPQRWVERGKTSFRRLKSLLSSKSGGFVFF